MSFRYLTVTTTNLAQVLIVSLASTAALLLSPVSHSEDLTDDRAAVVNNSVIKQATLNLLSQSRAQGPMSALEQNQEQILEDLITTELLVQAAKRTGTDIHPKHRIELELAHQTLLSQLYVKDFMSRLDISEEELREIYNSTTDRAMVQLSYWEFSAREEAQKFLAKFSSPSSNESLDSIPKGESDAWQPLDSLPFADLAQSDFKQSGDWLTRTIQEDDTWRVWRCENYSSIKKPPYEHVKEGIRQEIAQQKLQQHIRELRSQAVIIKNNDIVNAPSMPNSELIADRK